MSIVHEMSPSHPERPERPLPEEFRDRFRFLFEETAYGFDLLGVRTNLDACTVSCACFGTYGDASLSLSYA